MEPYQNYVRAMLTRTAIRVPLLIVAMLLAIAVLVSLRSYRRSIDGYQAETFAKLQAIVSSIAPQIDGSLHQELSACASLEDCGYVHAYRKWHLLLKETFASNELQSDIYTCIPASEDDKFYFVVTSADRPYFKHEWTSASHQQIDFRLPGTVGPYKDENGTWLSAYAPIRKEDDEVSGFVQADLRFDQFITQARRKAVEETTQILFIVLIPAGFLWHFSRSVLRKEDLFKKRILLQHSQIRQRNQELDQSIQSARSIQEVFSPKYEQYLQRFTWFSYLDLPLDTVSGDMLWSYGTDDRTLVALADCTGHGVPGAFTSITGKHLLDEIVTNDDGAALEQILETLDTRWRSLFQENHDHPLAGMDVALVSFDHRTKKLQFAGANRPILIIRQTADRYIADLIKGTKRSIGGHTCLRRSFESFEVDASDILMVCLWSDGLNDQFGGEKGKKLGSKRSIDFLMRTCCLPRHQRIAHLSRCFQSWKNDEQQTDDLMVALIELP